MVDKKRQNALASLAEEMNVTTSKRHDVNAYERHDAQKAIAPDVGIPSKKGRGVTNIPWYPKSAALKKELKLLALHEESSVTALIDEGIKMVLEKRGKNIEDYM